MQIVIQARGLLLTPTLRAHIERRLRFALDWANQHVRKLSVRLVDLNGPRGGEDKCCQIRLNLPGASAIVIEDTQADVFVAIDRATDRAGHTLARRMARRRQQRHERSRITDRPEVAADAPPRTTTET
ncbi:MAG TPA: HPF/RaiA family ribosome-associated protein [Accumulibacter sp.]|nr:HPF/RaiA family ribosome-associated protein [Accumulibacter sp.]HMW16901.1 HPF/RaiA family ribosome-associated protein [Accumulibacter sp.]HMY06447.1 HPF/RaiA family ribosome-associated protein [Accumulibacter sp.]HNE13092.1 HPF/RaiA family ribosome-associated protein [Accumulibacter sp.]HNG38826.1 HPF/RaiA family ribosome-associated protein [Accumulibacter sp.]